MNSAASSLRERLAEIPEPERDLVRELLADNAALSQNANKCEELLQGISELHSRCLELHESEISLHTQLGNIYVSASQLSSTLSRIDVVTIVQEIVTNLIGSEAVGIFELEGAELVLKSRYGIGRDRAAAVDPENELISGVLESLKSFFSEDGGPGPDRLPELTACVPLRAGDAPVGLITVFELLPQKQCLTQTDRDLLEVLGTLGGYALYCSGLHEKIGSRATGQP